MKENKNYDEVDRLMFEYFEKNKEETPYSTIMTIEKFSSDKKVQKTKVNVLKKIASIIIAIISLSASFVVAKEIVDYFFLNSKRGVENAAQNGYIQELNNDYIESSNISARISNIIMDDKNLDISFIYKYSKENVDSISFSDVLIQDEEENILYYVPDNYNKKYEKRTIGENLYRTSDVKKIDKNTFMESLLITTENNKFPHSKKLNIIAKKALINVNNNVEVVEGLWTFEVNLLDKFWNRTNLSYVILNNPNINDYDVNVTDTSLDIDLKLNVLLDSDFVSNDGNVVLIDENNVSYEYDSISVGNNADSKLPYKSVIRLHYNITKYDKLDKLTLTIKIDEKNEIILYLNSNN